MHDLLPNKHKFVVYLIWHKYSNIPEMSSTYNHLRNSPNDTIENLGHSSKFNSNNCLTNSIIDNHRHYLVPDNCGVFNDKKSQISTDDNKKLFLTIESIRNRAKARHQLDNLGYNIINVAGNRIFSGNFHYRYYNFCTNFVL